MYSAPSDETVLNRQFLLQPKEFGYRYTTAADHHLRELLFRSLAGQRDDYLRFFFPDGPPAHKSQPWSLRAAQGAVDGAEYTEAAKGHACGHIFKSGESTYHCKTCAADDTCVLCARCFESSEHDDHIVFISVSPGNSGCCDCGDHEAWRRDVRCSIHSPNDSQQSTKHADKDKAKDFANTHNTSLPPDLVKSMQMTISRAVNYLCDVFSCSPEQMRLQKTEHWIRQNEQMSRLTPSIYGEEPVEERPEFVLVLWNDEKHTIDDVQNQVARACSTTKSFGYEKAMQVNDIGRSCVYFSPDIANLIRMAEIIEQLKVTVTIRSARDTFREQMCSTIISWMADIAGCAVGSDAQILRNLVCEELLKPWQPGSEAINKDIGQAGIDDHEEEENDRTRRRYAVMANPTIVTQQGRVIRVEIEAEAAEDDVIDDDVIGNDEDEEDEFDEMEVEEQSIVPLPAVPHDPVRAADMDVDLIDDGEDITEVLEATLAGYPPPPPPPHHPVPRSRILTPTESEDGEEQSRQGVDVPFGYVPRTPRTKTARRLWRPSKHWLEKPEEFRANRSSEPCEDLWQRIRLDLLILYDLRLWKTLRISLRHLYITTVVTIPRFKRVLGLRFAALYTALAQLYLIADREPDHSIINLSVQMLTTPTITQEVVERGNFLSNLMAILYTFLTSRQVGFPEDVNPKATLAFDAGAVTNRRMFHFFLDLRWLCQSEFIQYHMRVEQRYLLQFIDLVKLHQGVCPNVRAVGAHIEYEPDTWISASMIVKEINKLCKQIAVSFETNVNIDPAQIHLQRAIRTVGQMVMINSFGYERKRFPLAEAKKDMAWHLVGPFEESGRHYSVPNHLVQSEPTSFHHPLHYFLSWLLENGKAIDRDSMRALLTFSPADLKDPWNASRNPHAPSNLTSDELLSSMFEHPLRLCVWLSQMKAGMWVRNGVTLRHQAHSYRSVSNRDVAYQRDLFMIQAGLMLCGAEDELIGERFLAQVIDRFQVTKWVAGDYTVPNGFDEAQYIDVIEDFFHCLIVALSDRGNLVPFINEREQHERSLRHDIAHTLCFKPLSFSDLAGRVTERVGEADDFNRILESMTNYKPPEGLTDSGTFELKAEFIELVDPYYAHYSRNLREEAEAIHKRHIARKTGKKIEEVVYEAHLQPIRSGLFKQLSAFTATPLFVRILRSALMFAVNAKTITSKLQATRIESFLHMVLHLTALSTSEDSPDAGDDGFVKVATVESDNIGAASTVLTLLVALASMEQYSGCHAMAKHIIRKMQSRRPQHLTGVLESLNASLDRADASSPASFSADDKGRKKQEALARQARIMAQMKQQQNSFLQNQGLESFGNGVDDFDGMSVMDETQDSAALPKFWQFPSGTCILCQEETDDQRLFGTFACIGESHILRATPVERPEYVREVLNIPINLDRSADHIRPFGVSGDNKRMSPKAMMDGLTVPVERQGLSKGFPHEREQTSGPVSTSCGHIMHFSCFELYLAATARRHSQQIARNHPERLESKEFICPLCKALGNTFLPIIWKGKQCANEHEIHAAKTFSEWLMESKLATSADPFLLDSTSLPHTFRNQEGYSARLTQYVSNNFTPSLATGLQDLSTDNLSRLPSETRPLSRRGYSLSSLFRIGHGDSQGSVETPIQSPTTNEIPQRVSELVKAYARIDETVMKNELLPRSQVETSHLNVASTLSRALGFSISAFEIAHRGVGDDPLSTSLVAELSEQSLAHLRILSETIESYQAVQSVRPLGLNVLPRQVMKQRQVMTSLVFGSDPGGNSFSASENVGKILFQDDIFVMFVDWLSFMAPSVSEVPNVLQLFYWAEIVKALFVLYRSVRAASKELLAMSTAQVSDAFRLTACGLAMGDAEHFDLQAPYSEEQLSLLYTLVNKYALTFLRKAIVLMHIRYGLDFDCPYDLNVELPEQERLTALLHIAGLEDLFMLYTSQSAASEKLRQVTKRWVYQAEAFVANETSPISAIVVPHPSIFELVGLPLTYDTLTEEAIRRRCPTTGKEIVDPAICLLCGEIFCSQAYCCMVDRSKGGCHQHMRRCGHRVGIFINIRKCMVLFSYGPGNGCFTHAPYLDKHGEPDPTLRRHHQLFLNQRRYDKLLRETWLSHLIPTIISRKLEGDINPGGWETL